MNIPYIMKRCSCCGEWLVASTVNFHKHKNGKYSLTRQCKKCRNKKNKQYNEANKERLAEYHKQYYEDNRDKKLEYQKQYYENNRDKASKHSKQYYENNKEKALERQKQWNRNNKDKIAKTKKRYRQSPKGQVAAFNGQQRRRIREEQQGDGITKDQWLEMMKYFDWKCAYSGEYIGGDSFNRTIDHIVPISTGGDNMIWNCVPMLRNLNSSKNDKEMEKWYKEQNFYNPNRLQKIYEWQEYAYNKYGKDTEYFNTNDIQIKLI